MEVVVIVVAAFFLVSYSLVECEST